jgi:hypothetical protein
VPWTRAHVLVDRCHLERNAIHECQGRLSTKEFCWQGRGTVAHVRFGQRTVRMRSRARSTRSGIGFSLIVLSSVTILLSGCAAAGIPETSSSQSEVRKKYPRPIDLANARAACLNELGWGVTVNAEGQISANFVAELEAEYESDDVTCLKKIGIDPNAPTPESVINDAYGIHQNGAKCLRKAGWKISKAPTFQTFKDTYLTDTWFPWDEVPDTELREALKQCPAPEPTY